jgi:uncharacterized protein (DUF736 family)
MEGKMDKNLVKVGAIWQNTSEEGNPYFNMDLSGRKFVVFPNGYKSEEKHPDFIVYDRVKETRASPEAKLRTGSSKNEPREKAKK